MIIELEQETSARLVKRATELGVAPEDLASELLRATLPAEMNPDEHGVLRDAAGNPLGFDAMTWRELAHAGHDR